MQDKFDVSKTTSSEENSQDSISSPSQKTTVSSKFTFFSKQPGVTLHGDHAHAIIDHDDHIHFLTMYADGRETDDLIYLLGLVAANDYAFVPADESSDYSSDEDESSSTNSEDSSTTYTTDSQTPSSTDSDSEESYSDSTSTSETEEEESDEDYGIRSLGL